MSIFGDVSRAYEWPRAVLHIDMDAFYVNVHVLDHPDDADMPSETEFIVKVTAVDRVWLRVFVDGEKVLERVLEKDESKEWTAKESVTMKSGNGQLVQVEKDGELLGELGLGLEERTCTLE